MHDCHRPDSPNTGSQTCRFCAAEPLWCEFAPKCVCVCASGVLYIQLTVSQSIFPVLPAPYCLSVCVSCTLAYLSEAAQTHLAVQPKARQRRCVPNTRAMFNSHANVEPRGDAMSDFKKTRKERLQDSQRHSLGSTSAGLTVSENIFNNSTWWIEKPKTQRGAF